MDKCWQRLFCLLAVLMSFFYTQPCKAGDESPLFAGTLLAVFSENIDPGKISIQPFAFVTSRYGIYNKDSNLVSVPVSQRYAGLFVVEMGLFKNVDFTLGFNGRFVRVNGKDAFAPGDLQMLFGFELSSNQKDSWVPDARFIIGESFPTGKYDGLNPLLLGEDGVGEGAFGTWFVFSTRKIFRYSGPHPFNITLNLVGVTYQKTSVSGVSIYGGTPLTKGKIKPGDTCAINLSYEYKFNQPWGWGFDLNYVHQNRSSFHTDRFEAPPLKSPSSEQFSFAPLIEYNFNSDFSISAGCWFTFAGRNASAFFSGFLTLFREF